MNSSAISFRAVKTEMDNPDDSPQQLFVHPLVSQGLPQHYLYALVHEIRNPLTNVYLAIECMQGLVRDKEMDSYIDMIMRNTNRINDLVTNMLTDRDTIYLGRGKFSVRDLLEDVLFLNMDRIKLRSVQVRKSFGSRDHKVRLDRAQLNIALTNIIINAIEAMQGTDSQLELFSRVLNGTCYIVIKDNGIGMSEEDLKHLFSSHFTKRSGGMGMGLAETLNILNENNISIDVRSVLKKGTRFILSFKTEPLAAA